MYVQCLCMQVFLRKDSIGDSSDMIRSVCEDMDKMNLLLMYSHGQGRLLHRIDSVAGRMYYRAKVDTAYIRRPESRWIVKLRANVSGAQIETEGTMDGVSYETELQSALRVV